MKKLLACRRSVIAIIAIICTTYIGIHNGIDVSISISMIVAAVCGANSYENSSIAKSMNVKGVDNVG